MTPAMTHMIAEIVGRKYAINDYVYTAPDIRAVMLVSGLPFTETHVKFGTAIRAEFQSYGLKFRHLRS